MGALRQVNLRRAMLPTATFHLQGTRLGSMGEILLEPNRPCGRSDHCRKCLGGSAPIMVAATLSGFVQHQVIRARSAFKDTPCHLRATLPGFNLPSILQIGQRSKPIAQLMELTPADRSGRRCRSLRAVAPLVVAWAAIP